MFQISIEPFVESSWIEEAGPIVVDSVRVGEKVAGYFWRLFNRSSLVNQVEVVGEGSEFHFCVQFFLVVDILEEPLVILKLRVGLFLRIPPEIVAQQSQHHVRIFFGTWRGSDFELAKNVIFFHETK